jgi:hypothetical protein
MPPSWDKSVNDIEIGFSSDCVGFALQRLAADRIRAPDLRLRRQDGAYAYPRYALTDAA